MWIEHNGILYNLSHYNKINKELNLHIRLEIRGTYSTEELTFKTVEERDTKFKNIMNELSNPTSNYYLDSINSGIQQLLNTR